MRQGTVVYFQCNNWEPSPEEAKRFIYEFLEGNLYSGKPGFNVSPELSTTDGIQEWIKKNNLCINWDVYDMSCQYWVTTTKEWLQENFPELLTIASEEPEDYLWKGDKKYFLKYTEENIGYYNISEFLEKYYPENFEKEKHRLICIEKLKPEF